MLSGLVNVAGVGLVRCVADGTKNLILDHLGKAHDGVQRRAQLMAHISQKLRFR